MNEQDIIKGNKLIAEFMGIVFYGKHNNTFMRDDKAECGLEQLVYHQSWDALMPVVEKIFTLSSVGIRMTPNIDEQYRIVLSFVTAWLKEN